MKEISRIDLLGKYIEKPAPPVEPQDYIQDVSAKNINLGETIPLSEYLTKCGYKLEDLYVRSREAQLSEDYFETHPTLTVKQFYEVPYYHKDTYKRHLESYKLQLALYEEYQKLLDVFRKSETEFRDKVRNELTEFLIEELKK